MGTETAHDKSIEISDVTADLLESLDNEQLSSIDTQLHSLWLARDTRPELRSSLLASAHSMVVHELEDRGLDHDKTEIDSFFGNVFNEEFFNSRLSADRIIDLAAIASRVNGRVILDIGCGDGLLCEVLQNEGFQVMGIDPSPVAVKLTRDRGVDVYEMTGEGLTMGIDSVDMAVTNRVLEFVNDPRAVIREANRISKIGSIHVVSFDRYPGEKPNKNKNKKCHSFSDEQEILDLFSNTPGFITIEPLSSGAVVVEVLKETRGGLALNTKIEESKEKIKNGEGADAFGVREDVFKQLPKGENYFVLQQHIRGIKDEGTRFGEEIATDLNRKTLLNLSQAVSVHTDLRFNCGDHLEGFTIFSPGTQRETCQFLNFKKGSQLEATIKFKHDKVWASRDMDGATLEPGGSGNMSGLDSWGKILEIDRGQFLICRAKSAPFGERYFEFALNFEKNPEMNGIWVFEEIQGTATEDTRFSVTKLNSSEPFHKRYKFDKAEEIDCIPDWQRPTPEAIRKLIGG